MINSLLALIAVLSFGQKGATVPPLLSKSGKPFDVLPLKGTIDRGGDGLLGMSLETNLTFWRTGTAKALWYERVLVGRSRSTGKPTLLTESQYYHLKGSVTGTRRVAVAGSFSENDFLVQSEVNEGPGGRRLLAWHLKPRNRGLDSNVLLLAVPVSKDASWGPLRDDPKGYVLDVVGSNRQTPIRRYRFEFANGNVKVVKLKLNGAKTHPEHKLDPYGDKSAQSILELNPRGEIVRRFPWRRRLGQTLQPWFSGKNLYCNVYGEGVFKFNEKSSTWTRIGESCTALSRDKRLGLIRQDSGFAQIVDLTR